MDFDLVRTSKPEILQKYNFGLKLIFLALLERFLDSVRLMPACLEQSEILVVQLEYTFMSLK
jgi:hypothetical protein